MRFAELFPGIVQTAGCRILLTEISEGIGFFTSLEPFLFAVLYPEPVEETTNSRR